MSKLTSINLQADTRNVKMEPHISATVEVPCDTQADDLPDCPIDGTGFMFRELGDWVFDYCVGEELDGVWEDLDTGEQVYEIEFIHYYRKAK